MTMKTMSPTFPPTRCASVVFGDADIVHTDTERSHANISIRVRKILAAGALPVVLGGDDSVNILASMPLPYDCVAKGPIHIVQIDAHRIW